MAKTAHDLTVSELIKKGNLAGLKKHFARGDVNKEVSYMPKYGPKTPFRATPLALAIEHRKANIVEWLIDEGADLSGKNAGDKTPALFHLFGFDKQPNVAMAKLLIAKGASVNAKDSRGVTILRSAVGYNKAPLVKLLLDKGADAKAKWKGQGMLTAVRSKQLRDLLVKHGATD